MRFNQGKHPQRRTKTFFAWLPVCPEYSDHGVWLERVEVIQVYNPDDRRRPWWRTMRFADEPVSVCEHMAMREYHAVRTPSVVTAVPRGESWEGRVR